MRIEESRKHRWLDRRGLAGTLAIGLLGLAVSLRPTAALAGHLPGGCSSA